MSNKVEQYMKMMKDFIEHQPGAMTEEQELEAIKAGDDFFDTMSDEEQREAAALMYALTLEIISSMSPDELKEALADAASDAIETLKN